MSTKVRRWHEQAARQARINAEHARVNGQTAIAEMWTVAARRHERKAALNG